MSLDKVISADNLTTNFQDLKCDILENTKSLLNKRGVKARNEREDNKLFSSFNNSLQQFIDSNNLWGSLVIDVFQDVEQLVLDFETDNETQIHKGSIYFNAGLCYLWQRDFDKALYYWVLTGEENKLTRNNPSHNIFFSESFNKNFGKSVNDLLVSEIKFDERIYSLIKGTSFAYPHYENYLKNLEDHDLVNMMINFFRRIHYDHFQENDATYLLYYRLVNDYCIMFETALKGYLINTKGIIPKDTIGAILDQNLNTSTIGPISTMMHGISASYSCPTVSQYNSVIGTLIADIESESNPSLLCTKILQLIKITRNKVAHDIDTSNKLYGNIDLCKRVIRLIIIAQLFDNYI